MWRKSVLFFSFLFIVKFLLAQDVDSILIYTFTPNGDSSLSASDVYSYDSQGNPLSRNWYDWISDSSMWFKTYVEKHSFDSKNRLISYCAKYRYYPDRNWQGALKYQVTFGADDSLLEFLYFQLDYDKQVWIFRYKTVYLYDNNKRLVSVLSLNWDTASASWLNSKRTDYNYDTAGHRILTTSFYWDSDRQYWIPQNKTSQVFDQNGDMVLQEKANWNSDSMKWIPTTKNEAMYYHHRLNEIKFAYWSSNQWVWEVKRNYYYDENGNDTLIIYSTWAGDDWRFDAKESFKFNAQNKLIEHITYNYDSENSAWKYDHKNEKDYDQAGNTILDADYDWDADQQIWIKKQKHEYQFDANNHLIFRQDYNGVNNQWHNLTKFEALYDANDLLTDIKNYKWVDSLDAWQPSSRTSYIYDEQGRKQITEFYNGSNSSWLLTRKYFHHWLEIPSFLPQQDFYITVFPNPAHQWVNILLPTNQTNYQLSFYSLDGRKVKHLALHQGVNTLDVSDLPAGTYILQIRLKNRFYSQKLLLQ